MLNQMHSAGSAFAKEAQELKPSRTLGLLLRLSFPPSHISGERASLGLTYRLHEEILSTEAQAVSHRSLAAISTHDNDWNVLKPIIFGHERQHFEAVHFWHG